MSIRGAPRYLRCDNGPEFVSRALLRWMTKEGIETAFIDPGKPWQNGTNESFNGRFRDGCLSMEWFRSRAEARAVIETWRRHYNEVRPPFESRRRHADRVHVQIHETQISDARGRFVDFAGPLNAGRPRPLVRAYDRV